MLQRQPSIPPARNVWSDAPGARSPSRRRWIVPTLAIAVDLDDVWISAAVEERAMTVLALFPRRL